MKNRKINAAESEIAVKISNFAVGNSTLRYLCGLLCETEDDIIRTNIILILLRQ